jgi:hypothetical protein
VDHSEGGRRNTNSHRPTTNSRSVPTDTRGDTRARAPRDGGQNGVGQSGGAHSASRHADGRQCYSTTSSYEYGEDKWRLHAASNHFILPCPQLRFITAEMISDGLAVDDRSKPAAKVAHVITSVTLLDHKMVARQSEWDGVIEFEIWLQWRQPFPCDGPPTNDERSC